VPGIVLAAIATPVVAAVRASAFGVDRSYADYRSMLEEGGIDIVAIATPTDLHYDICLAAAEAGAAIVCPPPLASTFGEAESMLHAVQRYGSTFIYGDPSIFAPLPARALDLVLTGTTGEVHRVSREVTVPEPPQGWRADIDRAGGGALLDLLCRGMLGAIRAAGGWPVEVAATMTGPVDSELEWGAVVDCHLANGCVVELSARRGDGPAVDRLLIEGEAATIDVDQAGGTLQVELHRGDGTSLDGERMDLDPSHRSLSSGAAQLWQHTVDVLAGRARPAAGIADAIAAFELACAAYAAAGSGQSVALPWHGGGEPPALAWRDSGSPGFDI
jgi:predicted dehydrogenase